MSKRDDEFDLPTVSKPRLPMRKEPAATLYSDNAQVELSEAQVGQVIDGGIKIAGDVLAIGKGIVEIANIREKSKAAVAEIDAKTRQIVSMMEKHIEAMQVEHEDLKTRGDIALGLVSKLTVTISMIPEADAESRRAAIEMIEGLADKTFQKR